MAKAELGTKRIDPETGKKFYDLGRDPIISPYTGKSYPVSYFENIGKAPIAEPIAQAEDPMEVSLDAPEFLTLEDADNAEIAEDNMPDLDDETTPMVDSDDEFLEVDDSDDEVKDLIGENFAEDEEL